MTRGFLGTGMVVGLLLVSLSPPAPAAPQGHCPASDSRLWVMADDGSGTSKLARADSFAWSPDARKFVVARRSAISILNESGALLEKFADTPGCDGSPQWAPDGRHVAFVGSPDNQGTLWLARTNGSKLKALATMENLGSPVWAPDSTRLAFIAGHDFNYDVFVVDSDGSNLRNVTADGATDQMPDWAPDGQTLAFASNRSGNFDIYTVGTDGSGLARLTVDTRWDWDPEWSPDGARIAFVRHQQGSETRLWTMSSHGGDEKDLMDRDGSPRFMELGDPQWSSTGQILFAAFPFESPTNIYSVGVESEALIQLTHFASFARSPRWSPAGEEIAFVNELVARGVSLELQDHLVASGQVQTFLGGFSASAACAAAVPVVIQRLGSKDWRRVSTTRRATAPLPLGYEIVKGCIGRLPARPTPVVAPSPP